MNFDAHTLSLLQEEAVRQRIAARKGDSPAQVALTEPQHGAVIATQVKYLQRAARKLPSYYEAECILPPLSFEQASSEESASERNLSGRACLDLTCGLGVDTLALACGFERVVSLEQNPILANVATENFRRIATRLPKYSGVAERIEVVNTPAEAFVASCRDTFDLIYADPDRRGAGGEKLVRLDMCSPDVVALMPRLLELAPRVIIKASPLFEPSEAFRLWGEQVQVEVISLRGECKEVLIEVRRPSEPFEQGGTLTAHAIGVGKVSFSLEEESPPTPPLPQDAWHYLLLPDVSLYKSRCWQRYAAGLNLYAPTPTSFGLSEHLPNRFLGRAFRIKEIMGYQPKKLKRMLRERGIRRATLLMRSFPIDESSVRTALGITPGEEAWIALTQLESQRLCILLEPQPILET